ncbi:Hypothetical predicted protein [Octopus vulgaris]|uniref:Uncharacterized protein n=1 Tax=Octopus vulgaris TaxID=6645 RepID=A0AA36AQB8_OCTVU|nr:Hypothetical predicted protein [Octopus vulgaris]
MGDAGTRKTNMNTRKRSMYTEQEDSEPEVSDPSRIVSTVGALYEAFDLKSVSSLPGKAKRESTRMENFDEAAKKRLVKLTSAIVKKTTYNLINDATNDVNEGNCESQSYEEDCASNENEIFDTDTVEYIGTVEKGRGSLTKCIVYGVEGNIPEKHRIGLAVASHINDSDMESDDENPLQCNLCRREFATAYKMEIHNCKGALGQQDLIS